jgi:tetratricopeptide (TPR) repeat protein
MRHDPIKELPVSACRWAGGVLLAVSVWGLSGCGSEPVKNPQTVYNEGVEALTGFRFDLATAAFDQVAETVPAGSPLQVKALLGSAICSHHKAPVTSSAVDRAVELYSKVIAVAPTSPESVLAEFHLGRIAEQVDFIGDKANLAAAREHYRKVIDRDPTAVIAGEATFRLMGTYVQTLDPAQVHEGIALASARVAKFPQDPWVGALWQGMGDAWNRVLNDPRKTIECFNYALAAGLPEPTRAWEVYWCIGCLQEQLGDKDAAVKAYSEIIVHYPTSGKAWEAQIAIKRLGVEPPPLRWFDASRIEGGAK